MWIFRPPVLLLWPAAARGSKAPQQPSRAKSSGTKAIVAGRGAGGATAAFREPPTSPASKTQNHPKGKLAEAGRVLPAVRGPSPAIQSVWAGGTRASAAPV